MNHLIGLVDCNNFFVSCERLFRPDLEGKPVVVLSSNDGCVIARSQEIKDKGIAMGVPYFQIKDTLKEIGATIFSSHHALYRDISRRVFDVVERELGEIEIYSVDECFFRIGVEVKPESLVAIRQQVKQEIGIPVSIGVASSKTRAKYANRLAKKTGGVCVLSDKEWSEISATIKLSEIWGVGIRTTKKLSSLGIKTVAEYSELDTRVVGQLFGVEGLKLQAELNGISTLPLEMKGALRPKSMMSTASFAGTVQNKTELEQAITAHVHSLVEDLVQRDLLVKTLRVLIYPSRYSDFAFQGASLEAMLVVPTNDLFTLKQQAIALLQACYRSGVPYKKAGVVMSSLVPAEGVTTSLFAEKQHNSLTELLLTINKRHRKNLLLLGSFPSRSKASITKRTLLSPSYTTNWSQIKNVFAR